MSEKLLADRIVQFIKNTIVGHESAIYKIATKTHPYDKFEIPLEITMLTKHHILSKLVATFTENYFNQVYESLVNKDDPYIINMFDELKNIMNHSPICLINIIAHTCVQYHIKLDRSLLITNSYESYMKSVNVILNDMFNENFMDTLISGISHKCNGDKEVKALPIGLNGPEKMFKFVVTPLYANDKKCVVCGKDTTKACSGCKDKKYFLCSKECQKIDWAKHPSTCTHKSK
jgi:hypothetical protein